LVHQKNINLADTTKGLNISAAKENKQLASAAMGNRNSHDNKNEYDSEQSKIKMDKIPKNIELIDLQKQSWDPHAHLLKDYGESFWVKIYTARLRDLIKEYQKNNNGKWAACDVDYLLKQVPVGTNYEWVDYKITARYPTDEFYRSCQPISRQIRVVDIGPNDYILIGADATPYVTNLLKTL
jgi:hypothetical protein